MPESVLVSVLVPGRAALAAALALCALAACEERSAPVVPWLYDAPLPPPPRPPTTGGFGRGDAPIDLVPAGVSVAPGVTVVGGPLLVEALAAAPAESERAEVAVFGPTSDGTALAVDLIDVDAGLVRWREATVGLAPLGLTPSTVVVGDAGRLAGLDRATGAPRWQLEGQLRGRDAELLAVGQAGKVLLVDARTGEAGPPLAPPVTPEAPTELAVVAVCGSSPPHLYAWHQGQLMRWQPGASDLLLQWSTPTPQPTRLDACGDTVLLAGGGEVRALDPTTGAVVGGPLAARDYWFARTGPGVELATDTGLEARDLRLGSPVRREDVIVDRLLARRGDRRLLAGRDGGVILLDGQGARALGAPFGAMQVALGDGHLISGVWAYPARTQVGRLSRWAPPRPDQPARPTPALPRPLLGDPPRLDLPAPRPLPPAVARDDAGAWAVGAAFVDPSDPERVYVGVLEARPSDQRGGGLAAYDLHRDAWAWHAPDACAPGTPVALAAAAEVVVCGTRGAVAGEAVVRAVRKQGGDEAWEWHGETVDAVLAAGGAPGLADVVVVLAGARLIVLDGQTGLERASWRTSDGYWPRVALVRRGLDAVLASYEHGHLVLRSVGANLRPFAALEVRGTVSAVFAVGDRIAVELRDGTLYMVDDAGRAVAAGALYLGWTPVGDQAVATGADGDVGLVVSVAPDGVPRVVAGLPGTGRPSPAGRASAPGAPLALRSGVNGGRVTVLADDGAPLAAFDLPVADGPIPVVSTVVHGRPVVGVVLAKPLRFVRVDVSE